MLLAALQVVILCTPVAVDGDTLRDCDGVYWRIARIDAPELRCRRGTLCDRTAALEAKNALARLIDGSVVTCHVVDADPRLAGYQPRDRFGRPVATCAVNNHDLGRSMLIDGHAQPWP